VVWEVTPASLAEGRAGEVNATMGRLLSKNIARGYLRGDTSKEWYTFLYG